MANQRENLLIDGTLYIYNTEDCMYHPVIVENKNEELRPQLSECGGERNGKAANNNSNHTEQSNTKLWSKQSTLALIDKYKQYQDKFKSTTTKNETVYKLIAEELKSEGFNVTATQCRDKFKYLKMKYCKKRDNMGPRHSGESPIHFDYYNELHQIFGNTPVIEPVSIASSSRTSSLAEESSDASECESGGTAEVKKRKRETRDEASERRHRERIERQDRAIACFDRFVTAIEKWEK